MEEEYIAFHQDEKPTVLKDDETPLIYVEQAISKTSYGRVIIGIWIAVALVGWRWWWIGAIATAVGVFGFFKNQYEGTRNAVRIYRGGLLSVEQPSPWSSKMEYWQIPWAKILHVDLREGTFSVQYDGGARSRGVRTLQTLSKPEASRIAELLKSHQHRGDIPGNFRVIDP